MSQERHSILSVVLLSINLYYTIGQPFCTSGDSFDMCTGNDRRQLASNPWSCHRCITSSTATHINVCQLSGNRIIQISCLYSVILSLFPKRSNSKKILAKFGPKKCITNTKKTLRNETLIHRENNVETNQYLANVLLYKVSQNRKEKID